MPAAPVQSPPVLLCRFGDLDDPGSKGFDDVEGEAPFFIVKRNGSMFGFRNHCPHYGAPLDWKPDAFLNRERDLILCSMHGALFDIASGMCVRGPCPGLALTPVNILVEDGMVWLKR